MTPAPRRAGGLARLDPCAGREPDLDRPDLEERIKDGRPEFIPVR